MLKSFYRLIGVLLICLPVIGSVSATERRGEDRGMRVDILSVEHLSQISSQTELPTMRVQPENLIYVAEGCLAKCDRESRECDKRYRGDDGSEGDVCERAYIKCDRACGD